MNDNENHSQVRIFSHGRFLTQLMIMRIILTIFIAIDSQQDDNDNHSQIVDIENHSQQNDNDNHSQIIDIENRLQ